MFHFLYAHTELLLEAIYQIRCYIGAKNSCLKGIQGLFFQSVASNRQPVIADPFKPVTWAAVFNIPGLPAAPHDHHACPTPAANEQAAEKVGTALSSSIESAQYCVGKPLAY
jgi:hypothetical protein